MATDGTKTDTTTQGQSGTETNEEVLNMPRIGTLPRILSQLNILLRTLSSQYLLL